MLIWHFFISKTASITKLRSSSHTTAEKKVCIRKVWYSLKEESDHLGSCKTRVWMREKEEMKEGRKRGEIEMSESRGRLISSTLKG